MKNKKRGAGLRSHRPKKKFRFEYIRGKFSGMTKERREIRLFSEIEHKIDSREWMHEVLSEYWKSKK